MFRDVTYVLLTCTLNTTLGSWHTRKIYGGGKEEKRRSKNAALIGFDTTALYTEGGNGDVLF